MSPHDINQRAHLRHAQRAAGLGGIGDGLHFPGFGDHNSKTDTNTAASASQPSASLGPSLGPSIPTDPETSAPPSSQSSAPPSTTQSPSTTPSPSSLSPSTTATGTALKGNLTKFVTQNVVETAQGVAAPSNSAVPAPTGGLVAPVIGGVAGGIIGLALLIFIVTFFIRRRGKGDDEAINFDPGSFRRSAMMLNDPPTHQDTVNRGFNPAPQMIETRSVYASQPNYDMSPRVASPHSGNPLVFEAPFSPITPGITATPMALRDPYDSAAPPILTRNLTRNSSAASSNSTHGPAQYASYPGARTSGQGKLAPEYVDMERSSVTPFQAAQYAEISQRLNTDMPKGLDTPAVEEFVTNMPATPIKDSALPPVPQDPFEDSQDVSVQDLSFPAPPSPVATSASRYRVDSSPPMLPEIVVQSRVSGVFPENSAGQTLIMRGAESPMGSRFPVTPSPLASSFSVATPPAAQSSFPAAPEPAAMSKKEKARPETVYDPEDAYGGF